MTLRNQRTLKSAVSVRGIGLHSGVECSVTLRPAEAGNGIVFVRTDLLGRPRIPLRIENVVQRERRTAIALGDADVHTVEHLTASLYALGVDNVDVEIDGAEVPGLDGSSLPYAEVIRGAGRLEQKAPRKCFTLDQPVAVQDGEASIAAYPAAEGLNLSYTLHYPGVVGLGTQCVALALKEETFLSEVAPARTFCLEAEAKALQEMGLGKGANTRNTLVLGPDGVKENTLRFPDEPARHKLLDLLGDLALLGCDLQGRVVATRSGHSENQDLVKKLAARQRELEARGVIQNDTGLDIREILKILPHRYPFLFVDRVIELEGWQRAVGLKSVSFNEPHFQGHWPGQPIMPGVLQIEALAQLAGVLLLRRLQNTGRVAVMVAIDHVKFRRPVVPGDQLRLECETVSLRDRSGKVEGRATVNGELSCQAVMKFMLMDA
ncbi:MAG: UDP-3-O-[3-hydroxymyristoyl] N-acetylglucosamine deacetylase [Planctomycetes bacterium]|nr:UDP-3-O-[3-hydroxymyristoyl] N-acetylglucosamine deacetylase [Planctomycetota bacterium]